jgi:uncharacterized protein (DUF2236 family)
MYDETMLQVRRKFVSLMKADPPPPVLGMPAEPLAPIFDRWVAKRFTQDEVNALFRMELEYGQRAVSEWFAEVLVEAGLVKTRRLAH